MKKDFLSRRVGMAFAGTVLGYIFGGVFSTWIYSESEFMWGFIFWGTVFAILLIYKAFHDTINE